MDGNKENMIDTGYNIYGGGKISNSDGIKFLIKQYNIGFLGCRSLTNLLFGYWSLTIS